MLPYTEKPSSVPPIEQGEWIMQEGCHQEVLSLCPNQQRHVRDKSRMVCI